MDLFKKKNHINLKKTIKEKNSKFATPELHAQPQGGWGGV